MAKQLESEKVFNNNEVITAFTRIPYSLINSETTGSATDTIAEFTEICKFYNVYKKGAVFTQEGTGGHYIPADLRYRMTASLINKQARFLFAEQPDIVIEHKGDKGKASEDAKNIMTTLNDFITTVLRKNRFEDMLIKAAKDCFIGKRVAGLVNFNIVDGVTITFLPSTQFLYETRLGNDNILTKFVAFIIVKESSSNKDKRIFKKKYTMENETVYLEETLYDGAGTLIEEITSKTKVLLPFIPVSIFINDGLTGDGVGESEVEVLQHFEQWYSKLSNADIDSERKNMNPIRYAIDLDPNSTKNLSSAAGAFWDLASDQNNDNTNVEVGLIESSMSYSDALKTSLDRIKTTGYEQVDMPNITLETMQGNITSGKALKAIYWPLIVRCKEKMKTWRPGLEELVYFIIEGSKLYPNCIEQYTSDPIQDIAYEVIVVQNMPLPEDEIEEKQMDLSEVESQTMSKKSYMKKWRQLTDDEVNEELEQIALERQILEDAAFGTDGGGEDMPYPDNSSNQNTGESSNPFSG